MNLKNASILVIDDDTDVREALTFALEAAGLCVAAHESAVAFLDAAPISDEDKAKLYHKNAERIFHIKPGESS